MADHQPVMPRCGKRCFGRYDSRTGKPPEIQLPNSRWIAAHAASDGSGLEFDADVWASIEDETGLTMEQAKAGVDALIGAGLLTAVGQPTHDRLVARAVI
jgi:hypothetical protein